jgi:hypothetical protein
VNRNRGSLETACEEKAAQQTALAAASSSQVSGGKANAVAQIPGVRPYFMVSAMDSDFESADQKCTDVLGMSTCGACTIRLFG